MKKYLTVKYKNEILINRIECDDWKLFGIYKYTLHVKKIVNEYITLELRIRPYHIYFLNTGIKTIRICGTEDCEHNQFKNDIWQSDKLKAKNMLDYIVDPLLSSTRKKPVIFYPQTLPTYQGIPILRSSTYIKTR